MGAIEIGFVDLLAVAYLLDVEQLGITETGIAEDLLHQTIDAGVDDTSHLIRFSRHGDTGDGVPLQVGQTQF